MLPPPVAPQTPGLPLRVLSVDVEEYFHIEAAHGRIARADWNEWPSRVERSVDLLLELLGQASVHGTFFILGAVAQRHPALVQRIASAGHEIASHGTNHDRLHRLDPARFRADLLTCKHLLEDLTGRVVRGYRAPTFSVTPATAWAIDVLLESGFSYDASIFPVLHPAYGVPAAPVEPFFVQGSVPSQRLLEVPPLVWRWRGRNLAVAGGGYFRLLPLWFMRRGLEQAQSAQRPAILYFHPWEFDPQLPRMPLSLTGRLRTYTGLRGAADKLRQILHTDGRWGTIAAHLGELRHYAERRTAFDLAHAA